MIHSAARAAAPNSANWNSITGNLGVNNELEYYTSSTRNIQQSGGSTLQIVPWRDSSVSGGWTSGRLESKYTLTPPSGRRTLVEAQIRFGSNSVNNKQGIWPAFWMLGDSIRHGGGWPACGEIDILETVNGQLRGYGTLHCDVSPGGICNENNGLGNNIGIPDQEWHTWRVIIDRTPGSWTSESVTWYMDGQQFQQITGSRINNQNVWNAIAHSPLFFILNVAVGGSWVSSSPIPPFLVVPLNEAYARESTERLTRMHPARQPQWRHPRRLRLHDGSCLRRSLYLLLRCPTGLRKHSRLWPTSLLPFILRYFILEHSLLFQRYIFDHF